MTTTPENAESLASLATCALRCRERRALRDWYRRALNRLIRCKRIYQGAVIGYVVFDPTVSAILLPFLISLVPIVLLQHGWARRWQRQQHAVAFYRRTLERLQGRWSAEGDAGERYLDGNHPYARDLDIFGPGSLFQWFCTPRMSLGRDTLAEWLLQPADRETILARQAATRELATQIDFRETLDAVSLVHARLHCETYQAAATAEHLLPWRWLYPLIFLLAWCWLVCLVLGWSQGGWWWKPCLCGLAVETAVYLWRRAPILVICQRGYEIGLGLNAVSAFANLFARHSWHSPLLQNLAADVRRPYHPLPSINATGVGWVLQLPVAYFLATQLVPLFETRLLARLRQLPGTLDLIGQGEALAAFAAQAFEHPADCFPQLAAEDPCFIATGIAHSLIPPQQSVRNDLRLDKQLQMLLVSGSNMSGKSTLLRTVGVNAVLALAGAPVRARQLTISPLLVATAMQFQDSLGCGTSFFSPCSSACRSCSLNWIVRNPCCSCSMRSCRAPIRTIGGPAPKPSCAAWSRRAQSDW